MVSLSLEISVFVTNAVNYSIKSCHIPDAFPGLPTYTHTLSFSFPIIFFMIITFLNLSNHVIAVTRLPSRSHWRSRKMRLTGAEELGSIMPSQVQNVQLNGPWSNHFLFESLDPTSFQSVPNASKECLINSTNVAVRITLSFNTSWQILDVSSDCPWRLYCTQSSRGRLKVLILQKRSTSSFLSELPDSLPLSTLVLPGTHDTMAFYGYPFSQCQTPSTPLSVQLLQGIRTLDIRLSVIKGELIAYHGIYPQRTPFTTILASVHAFLTSPQGSKETIVMSIKQEDFTTTPKLTFSTLVKETMMANPGGWQDGANGSRDTGMWFLDNRIPKLGEVRGKVVLFSRFGGNGEGWQKGLEGMGIHPLIWPDSSKEGFEWMCKETLVKTHDWYNIPSFLSIPEKVALSTRVLIPEVRPETSPNVALYKPAYTAPIRQQPPLAISFLSAASFPLSLPPIVARGFGWPKLGLGFEGVNSRFRQWLLGILDRGYTLDLKTEKTVLDEDLSARAIGPRVRGWVFMDYFDEPEHNGIIPLLIECNFRGRVTGEEGWP